MQLRYLQTLTEMGASIIDRHLPDAALDIVKRFLDLMSKDAAAAPSANGKKVPALSGQV